MPHIKPQLVSEEEAKRRLSIPFISPHGKSGKGFSGFDILYTHPSVFSVIKESNQPLSDYAGQSGHVSCQIVVEKDNDISGLITVHESLADSYIKRLAGVGIEAEIYTDSTRGWSKTLRPISLPYPFNKTRELLFEFSPNKQKFISMLKVLDIHDVGIVAQYNMVFGGGSKVAAHRGISSEPLTLAGTGRSDVITKDMAVAEYPYKTGKCINNHYVSVGERVYTSRGYYYCPLDGSRIEMVSS